MAETRTGNEQDEFDDFGHAALIDYELSQESNTGLGENCESGSFLEDDPSTNDHDLHHTCSKLREQLCTLKGENRYLRSMKERLDIEIKNIDKENKATKLTHEEESRRQQEVINVHLAFKNKEIQDLTDRCKQLSDQLNRRLSSAENNNEMFSNKVEHCPARKRSRPSVCDIDDDKTIEHSLVSERQSSSFSPQSLTIACRTNAILASECGINCIKELIKSLATNKPLTEHEHEQEVLLYDDCNKYNNDDSDSDESDTKWLFDSLSQCPSDMSSVKAESFISEDSIITNTPTPSQTDNDDLCFLKSMYDVYDTHLQHGNCLSSLVVLSDTVCSNNAAVLKFIEDSVHSFYNAVRLTLDTIDSTPSVQSQDTDSSPNGGNSNGSDNEMKKEADYCTPATSSSIQVAQFHYSSPLSCYSSVSSQSTCSNLSNDSQVSDTMKSKQTKLNILQVLDVLKTLCTHDKHVREAIVHAKLPNEVFDDFTTFQHFSGTNTQEQNMADHDVVLSERCSVQQTEELMKLSEDSLPDIGLLSNRVLLPSTHEFGSLCVSLKPKRGSGSFYYNGVLLSLLIQTLIVLGSLQNKKQIGMLNTILEILILLSDECDPVMLERYSVLIQKDQNTLESLLRREDSVIILNVLTLLTKISRSSFNVSLLCSSSKSCVLGNCYTLFSKPPSPTNSEITIRIWLQLVRFIGQVLSIDGGESVLLDSNCGCSELLMQYLLICLVDLVHIVDSFSFEEDYPYSNECYSLIVMMLIVTQSILHHEKQNEYVKQNVTSRHGCLYSINCCLRWSSHISEEVLQDIYQQLISDNEENDTDISS